MKFPDVKIGLYAAATSLLLLCSSQNYAQQYYKWMDAQGSTHYTTTPPPKGAKRLDKVATYGGHPVQPTTSQTTSAPNSPSAQAEARHAEQVVKAVAEAESQMKPASQSSNTPDHQANR